MAQKTKYSIVRGDFDKISAHLENASLDNLKPILMSTSVIADKVEIYVILEGQFKE